MSQGTLLLALGLVFAHEAWALVDMTVFNNCSKTIWPARYDYRRDTGPFVATEYPTGWRLPSQSSTSINFTSGWSGYLWARQECDETNWRCKTGNCGGNDAECYNLPNKPVTRIGWGVQDTNVSYTVTFDGGSNLGVRIEPPSNCETRECGYDWNKACSADSEAAVSSTRQTLACWATDDEIHSTYLNQCPQVEALADDSSGTAYNQNARGICNDTTNAYTLTFCPDGDSMSDAVASDTPAIPTSSPSSSSSLSSGAIAGISIGAVAVAALLGFLAFFVTKKRKQEKEQMAVDPFRPMNMDVNESSPFMAPDSIPLAWKVTPFTIGGAVGDRKSASDFHEFGATNGSGSTSPPVGSSSKMRDNSFPASARTSYRSSYHLPHQQQPSSSSSLPSPTSFEPPPGVPQTQTDRPRTGSSAVDIRRLFEDRQFEGELLNFLADRMDPPASPGGAAGPTELEPPMYYEPEPSHTTSGGGHTASGSGPSGSGHTAGPSGSGSGSGSTR